MGSWNLGGPRAQNNVVGAVRTPRSSSCNAWERCRSVAWPQRRGSFWGRTCDVEQVQDRSGAGFATLNRYQVVPVEDLRVQDRSQEGFMTFDRYRSKCRSFITNLILVQFSIFEVFQKGTFGVTCSFKVVSKSPSVSWAGRPCRDPAFHDTIIITVPFFGSRLTHFRLFMFFCVLFVT